MKQAAQVVIGLWLALFLTPSAAGEAAPDPAELLQAVRSVSAGQQAEVRGRLRGASQRWPFVLQSSGGRMRFTFEDPARVWEVRLGPESSEVFDGEGRPAGQGMKEAVVPGAGVTVEDLALGFLYWPDARLLGDGVMRTRAVWRLELRPGRRGSAYAVVRVWIDKESGALMKIEGFDGQGRLARRFEVVSGQKIEGRWMLKQMRIESFAPEDSGKAVSRNYLEITGALTTP